ncbi:MAG: nitroreductase family protein [Oscillospiraceae bacterium]|nr:nitroreductase family protein [Oscillospiraceae bacterium]
MKKRTRLTTAIILILLAALMMSVCAFASGEASGETESNTVAKVKGETAAEVILNAFACKNFSDEELTDDEIEAIIQAGINAPSAMNSQPWQFVLIENDELKESLVSTTSCTVIIVAVPTEDSMGASMQFQAGLAAESMYLYAQSIGLAANMYVAPCSMTINVDDESKALYGIAEGYEAAIVLGIGHYADEADAYSSATARNDYDSFVSVVE